MKGKSPFVAERTDSITAQSDSFKNDLDDQVNPSSRGRGRCGVPAPAVVRQSFVRLEEWLGGFKGGHFLATCLPYPILWGKFDDIFERRCCTGVRSILAQPPIPAVLFLKHIEYVQNQNIHATHYMHYKGFARGCQRKYYKRLSYLLGEYLRCNRASIDAKGHFLSPSRLMPTAIEA